jgi:hypothetical protein
MKKFVYTITKRTHNRNGHGYIYITVHEIKDVECDTDCPVFFTSSFKIGTMSNVPSEVMHHLAKIGKIDKEYISGNYTFWNAGQFPFRIWEI